VDRRWVVNSSPLIVLARISHLHLITDMCSEIVIPDGVAQEIDCGPKDDPARKWLREEGQRFVVCPGLVEPVVKAWDQEKHKSSHLRIINPATRL